MSIELQRVRSHFDADGEGHATCPFCKHHSLTIDPGKKVPVLVHCFGCDHQAALAKIASTIASDATAPIRKQSTTAHTKKEWSEDELNARLMTAQRKLVTDSTAQKFLAGRGISLELAQQFGLGSGHYYYEDRLVIPYFDGVLSESLLQLRYRRLRELADKKGKWMCDKRSLGGRRLFNLPLLQRWSPDSEEALIITEAELDAMMLVGLGVNSASVDTAGHRLLEPDLVLLRRVKHLVLAFDQDEAGAKCTARFKAQLPHARVIGEYGVKDLGDLRTVMGPAAFEQRIKRFLGGK